MSETLYEECRLEGGPGYMPDDLRSTHVSMTDHKVKVMFYNGWEHFERIDEFTETGVPIFRWTMRTKTAE
ncbi:DUF5988 family protein [Micromonospora sp. NPDC023888]|uniref:DUF5988 family protein n=1 Tax=Micromonospora sp. NPDC023888 TaxID=3155607 RepID=UPI0033D0A646